MNVKPLSAAAQFHLSKFLESVKNQYGLEATNINIVHHKTLDEAPSKIDHLLEHGFASDSGTNGHNWALGLTEAAGIEVQFTHFYTPEEEEEGPEVIICRHCEKESIDQTEFDTDFQPPICKQCMKQLEEENEMEKAQWKQDFERTRF